MDGDDQSERSVGVGERRDLVVHEIGVAGGRDHVHIADGGGLAFARYDPDGAVGADPGREVAEWRQVAGGVRGEKDDVRVGFGQTDRDVRSPCRELRTEARARAPGANPAPAPPTG